MHAFLPGVTLWFIWWQYSFDLPSLFPPRTYSGLSSPPHFTNTLVVGWEPNPTSRYETSGNAETHYCPRYYCLIDFDTVNGCFLPLSLAVFGTFLATHFFRKAVLIIDWDVVKRQCLWKWRWSVQDENHSWYTWKPAADKLRNLSAAVTGLKQRKPFHFMAYPMNFLMSVTFVVPEDNINAVF